MANVERLEAVMTYIKDHPTQHNQSLWIDVPDEDESCGTTACFAGWTAMLYGKELGYQQRGNIFIKNDDPDYKYDPCSVAIEALELTFGEYHELFYTANDAHECEVVVKAIANGEDPGQALDDNRAEKDE